MKGQPSISARMATLQAERQAENARHRQELRRIAAALKQVQADCDHPPSLIKVARNDFGPMWEECYACKARSKGPAFERKGKG